MSENIYDPPSEEEINRIVTDFYAHANRDDIARLRNQLHAESVAIQARLEAELRATREQRDAAVAELRRLEWCVFDDEISRSCCPRCSRNSEIGHAPDCTLAAVLAMGEGGGSKPT